MSQPVSQSVGGASTIISGISGLIPLASERLVMDGDRLNPVINLTVEWTADALSSGPVDLAARIRCISMKPD